MTNGIPRLNKPQYRVIFYHSISGDILKYKFTNIHAAEDFMDRLDPVRCKPTLYEMTRIR